MLELECLPYAVGHATEGVCLLVRIGTYRILLDCGLQDVSLLKSHDGSLPPADVVLCSHAHQDHARGLLALHQAYPQLPIYASGVTAKLLPLNWPEEPEVPDFCQPLAWRSPFNLYPDLTVELWPAGHLPGAAAALITHKTSERDYTLIYTGDYLLSSSRLVDGLPLDELRGLRPDILITEGSYGTSRHPHRRQQENQLAERIHRAIANGQSVLLPTEPLGLGQELLMLLRSHHHFTGRDIDIWVDGMVAAGCDAYLTLMPYLPSTVQNFARHQPLFWDTRVRPRVRRWSQRDEHTGDDAWYQTPCIVITDDVERVLSSPQAATQRWLLLLTEQPGRSPQNLYPSLIEQMPSQFQSFIQSGQWLVDTYLLSEHCDGPGTAQLIHNLRPQHVIFVHGAPQYLTDLTGLDELQSRYHLHCPTANSLVELPIGEMFHQPAPPDIRYEGELTELETIIMVTLPENMTHDPRWQHLADTGLVEARWQGDELVLRGVSQRELLSQGTEAAALSGLECCENCRFFRKQRCSGQNSPLFGFKVTPEGYCPAFEPRS
ncbi:MAG: MBL fold metallo-hydrolase [Elainellaceae cyanobacterium]